jgi:seryl-tRNA synthetase
VKKMSRRLTLKDMKSIHNVGIRSIPKIHRSNYLELYMLGREKDRIEKEIFELDKRRDSVKKQLDGIYKRIEKLQKEIAEEKKSKPFSNTPSKPLKTMAINY